MTPATRATRPVIGLVILTTLSLILSLGAYVLPSPTIAATATVDGRVTDSDGYSKFADIFTEGEQVATVWWTRDASYVYFALELNALGEFVVNENVYAPSPTGYHEAAVFDTGWNNHNFGHLLNSDAARFQLACGGDIKHDFIQDYLYTSGATYLSGPASDGSVIENGPAMSSSSMVWNSTLGYTDFATQSPDFDPEYPTPDDSDVPAGWVWEMTYEFAVAAAPYEGCSTTFAMPAFPGSNTLGGMHNSPSKFGGDSIIVEPIPEPSVSVAKTPDGGTINAGDPIVFTMTVSNGATATGNAEGLTISDHLPAGFSWASDQEAACDITTHLDHQDLTCAVPTLAPGTGFTVQVSAATGTETSPCGLVENTFTVSGDDIVTKTDGGSVTIDCPAIRIEKTPDDGSVEIGDAVTFVLTVFNDGSGTASGVTIFDDLPGAGWSVVNDPASTSLSNCLITDPGDGEHADKGQILTCGPDSVLAGETNAKQVTVTKTATYPGDCLTITNLGAVFTTNNGSDEDTGVIDVLCARIEVDKTPNDGSIDAGELATFTIRTTNTGSAPALGVSLEDTLPATENGWTIVTNWTDDELTDCDLAGLELDCGPITLDDGDHIDVVVQSRTTAEDCGDLVNLAATATSTNDGSDSDDGMISVACPDLEVSKSASTLAVLAPGSLSYAITATNAGDAAAQDVNVSDDLDDDLVITDASFDVDPGVAGGEGSCDVNHVTNEVSCDVGSLAANDGAAGGADTVVVTILVGVPTDACGDLRNTASVSASNESAEGNNSSNEVVVDVDCPDVSVTKTADEPEIDAGGAASFTIRVDGGEFGTTSDVILTDTLPLSPSPWTVGGPDIGDCSDDDFATLLSTGDTVPGGTEIECNFGALGPDNDTREITLTADTTTVNCDAKIRNDATIDVNGDTNAANNTDWDEITVFCPDVSVEKAGGDPVNAGELATFEITVTAGGTGTSTNVTLTDDLIGEQGDWTFDVTGAPDGDCSITAVPELLCDFGNLDAGTVITIDLTYQTDADDCPSISNTASVFSDNDTDASNDTPADAATVRVDCPDLGLVKDGSGTVSAGDQASFTLTVTNHGPGDAKDVVLTDELPTDGLSGWAIFATFGIDPADCEIDDDDMLTCTLDELAAGATFSVTVVATTDSDACPSIENDALVSATNEPENGQFANDDSYVISVDCPDVTVEKESVASPISAGQDGEFTIEVTNLGPGTAYNLTVTDTAPEGTVWTVLDDGGFACDDDVAGEQQTITCTLDELGDEDSATILIGYTTSPVDCGVLNNAVGVAAENEPLENTENNSDEASIVVECPGLNLVKTADADPIDAGELTIFTILIWNAGEGTALDATFSDELPAGLTWHFELVNADDDDTCASSINSEGEQAISCEFNHLAPSPMPGAPYSQESPGKVIRVWAEADRGDCGLITNTAFAGASNDDTLDSTDTITVKCPTIALDKENNADDPVLPGTTVTYTLTLTVDDGPAKDVEVVDTLPDGLDEPMAISDGGVFDGDAGTITWSLGDLADGEYTLTYQAAVGASAEHGDELVNVAVATSTNSQCPDLESLEPDCEDTSTVEVRVPALTIEKAADAEEIVISGPNDDLEADPAVVTWTLTYTLTNGPVTNAVISDELPAGLVYVEGSASDGGAYDEATNTLTWTFATLTEGGSVTFETEIDPETISRVAPTVNVAVISSDQTPEDEGEDEVTVSVEPPPLGGNPTPTPKPELPDTATAIGPNGEPITVPVELLVAFFLGSLGVLTLANVRAARTRQR